ncbi:MAG: 50S ribosomal protein L16 [Nanoarchaeota archaeon]|nr:50S ribosomal protein L16 [Nanoarchaeota archaeon]
MARARKFCAYRRVERAYTRRSKFTEKSFVKANPNLKIVRFEMGNQAKKYTHTLNLKIKGDMQVRHDSIESARQVSNRHLEADIGKNDYFLKILVYPHHILRENPLAAGAGADRMSTGMKCSFGKPIGLAARLKNDQTVFQLKVNKNHLEAAKSAIKKASYKLPGSWRTEVVTSEK